jgi:hypothetical protein
MNAHPIHYPPPARAMGDRRKAEMSFFAGEGEEKPWDIES